MINISIITQEDKFFIPNIKLLMSHERICLKAFMLFVLKDHLRIKKYFFKIFLFAEQSN